MTTILLLALTLIAAALWALAVDRLRGSSRLDERFARSQWAGLAVIPIGCGVVFFGRWFWVTGLWQPLQTHLDGLLLMATLLGVTLLYMHARPRLRGLTAFALPVLMLALLWAICAVNWTYEPFHISPGDLWLYLHLFTIYVGTVSAFIAAIAGGMYLFIQRRLQRKTPVGPGSHLASLETLESLIIHTATLGFVLLTLGLVSGLVIVTERSTLLGPAWYASLKVWLSAGAWLAYALVMNVRYASAFRGARAAYLSIAGMVLLIATYGVATRLPTQATDNTKAKPITPTTQTIQEDS